MASKEALLKAIPVGKENAISMAELERKVGNPAKGTNSDQTRREVGDLILEDKIPVITSKNGVWIADKESEIKEAIRRKERTIKAHEQKIRALKESCKKVKDENS